VVANTLLKVKKIKKHTLSQTFRAKAFPREVSGTLNLFTKRFPQEMLLINSRQKYCFVCFKTRALYIAQVVLLVLALMEHVMR
jgi:hypothetical protein